MKENKCLEKKKYKTSWKSVKWEKDERKKNNVKDGGLKEIRE